MKARSLELHPQTTKKLVRLKREAEQDGEYRVAKRLHATVLNGQGKTSGEISLLLPAPRSKVSEWLANYELHGVEGLLEGHRTGRPCSMTENQKQILEGIIDSGPVAYGFVAGIWTSVMIAQVIADEFGVLYDPRHVRRLLSDLDFSLQRPKRHLLKANPVLQNRWRRYQYPRIKKKPALKGRH